MGGISLTGSGQRRADRRDRGDDRGDRSRSIGRDNGDDSGDRGRVDVGICNAAGEDSAGDGSLARVGRDDDGFGDRTGTGGLDVTG